METAHFGSLLREARERCDLSLSELAQRTRVPRAALELIEAGRLQDLPAEVYVRGFIRSYARSVGIAESQPLGLFEQALTEKRRAEEALAATPTTLPTGELLVPGEEDGLASRRGIGLAVFVIILLLIATITLSLFLRQPPQSGERLSFGTSSSLDRSGPRHNGPWFAG